MHTPLLTTRPSCEAKYEAKGAPEEAWGQEGKRKVRLNQTHPVYAGMVEAMDTAVGMVMAALDEAGVAENTVVIFHIGQWRIEYFGRTSHLEPAPSGGEGVAL